MTPEKNDQKLTRWLLTATIALLALVLTLQVRQMLSGGTAAEGQSLAQEAAGPEALQATETLNGPAANVPGYKAAMIKDVQALNPALDFSSLAALGVEELDQLLAAGAPGLPIGTSLAAHLAEEYAGTLEVDAITWEVDSELDETPAHYEVELRHVTLGDFEYKIDAYTGEVLEGTPDILRSTYVPVSGGETQSDSSTSVAPSQTGTQPAAPENDTHVPQASAPAAQQSASSGELSSQTGEEAAKAAAFAHAGIRGTDADQIRCKLDWEDGVRVYEIEFRAGGIEYDYEIEAATGTVLKSGQKWGGGASGASRLPSGGQSALIGESAAQSAALAHAGVPLENVGYIKGEIDEDDGIRIYEIEFVVNGIEYEYEIDAHTGTVLKAEQEQAD